MSILKREWRILLIGVFILADIFVWYAVFRETPSQQLVVAFLDVGQGDAIYIESPVHNRIMVDGGPSRSTISELREVMPFYVRTIDTLVVTNPDADHYSGFIDVLEKYEVKRVIEPGTRSGTERYMQFAREVDEEGADELVARRGQVIHLGGGADLTILFPDRDVSKASTNEGSIIAKLTYGNTSVMLAGDAPNAVTRYQISLDGTRLDSDILKVGHHGSRTSASEDFFEIVSPQFAIISAGLNNRYGHPHKETTDLLQKLKIPTFITFKHGTITAISDGKNFQIKTEK